MSTSNRTLIAETSFASVLVLGVVALTSPSDLGVPDLGFHPAWLPITLFAARYGPRGLVASVIAISAPLFVVGSWFTPSDAVLIARAHNPSDVFALLTAVAATWIGMGHENRVRRAIRRYEVSKVHNDHADAAVGQLNETVEILRGRCDRMDTSLTLWRSLAQRFERGTPAEAARAALELCALRCGATAGIVQHQHGDGGAEIIADFGAWRVGRPRPRELSNDGTVQIATRTGRPSCAKDIFGSASADSDVAIPIVHGDNKEPLGVLALRGVDPTALHAAELRDLRIIADWLAPQLSRLSVKPHLRAVPEEGYR